MSGSEELQPGTHLDGRYEVVRLLGQGGMASVYEVRHLGLHSSHALKVLNADLAKDPELRGRFLSEGRIQARLRHPHIVQVTEIVTTPVAGLVMDYVEGPTLGDRVHQEGALELDDVLAIFLPVLDAMEEAHKAGVVHRDLKPDNIILGRDSRGRLQPKVTDFGIAKLLRDEEAHDKQRTRAGARMGTLLYMSPEQVRGADEVDARSDIFSLGAILYEVATGKVAFAAPSDFGTMSRIVEGTFEPPERVVGGLPPVLAGCIRKALAVDPAERFQDCAAFRVALEPVKDPAAQAPPKPSRSYAVTSAGSMTASNPEQHVGVPPAPSPRNAPAPAYSTAAPASVAQAGRPLASPLGERPPGVASVGTLSATAPVPRGAIAPTVGASPIIAMLAGLFCLPGVGQLYNEQIFKGLCLMGLWVSLVTVFAPGGVCLAFTMNVLFAIDGYRIAAKRKRGQYVGAWEFF